MAKNQNKARPYLIWALFFVLAFSSGIGIGYIWASAKQVNVVCHGVIDFPGLRT